MSSQDVLIVGAGICGLAIAQGLKKANIRYTIFEAEEESTFRPREWTMALHWSLPMLESLLPKDLAKRVRTDAVVDASLNYDEYPNNVVPLYDGVSGELVREIPSDGIRVSRRELRAVCAEGIDVKFGHTLTHISYDEDSSVTAYFANGSTYIGTLIIGADGGRSAVRQDIFGPDAAELSSLGGHYLNVHFRYPDAEKALHARSANPVATITLHPDSIALLSMQSVPDSQDPASWSFQAIMMWKGKDTAENLTNEEKHAEVRERAAKLREPIRSAFLWMPNDIKIQYSGLGYWIPPTETWDTENGRVTLAGDAAHPMPPHRGQGLNNALNDAYNFVAAVKAVENGEGRREVIQKYSQEVAERGGKEVKLSKETAELLLDYERFRESALMTQGLRKG